jgi:hypothetical protein
VGTLRFSTGRIAALGLAIGISAGHADGTTRRWVGAGTGLWSTAGNWSPSGAPVANDTVESAPPDLAEHTAVYDRTTPLTLNFVRIDGGFGGGRMILDIPAAGNLTSTTFLVVGESSFGQLLQRGTVKAQNVIITNSNHSSSFGSYKLSGNALLTVNEDIQVGAFHGGEVVQDAGTVNVAGRVLVGRDANVNGTLGTYTLRSGTLTSTSTIVGQRGDGTFTHEGGTHQVTETLMVGQASDLNNWVHAQYMLSGGDVRANQLVIGKEFAGRTVTARFDQTDGRTEITNSIMIADDTSDDVDATLSLRGGVMRAPSIQRNRGGLPTLELKGGELQTSLIELNVLNQGSTLTPYSPTGLLRVVSGESAGNFSQTSGSLLLGIAGSTPGVNQGQLLVSGALALGGNVEIDFADGFSPAIGGRFSIARMQSGTPVLAPATNLIFRDAGYFGRLEVSGSAIDLVMVPEPASLALLAAGLMMRRTRRA